MTPNDSATRFPSTARRLLIGGIALAAALSLGGVAAYAATAPAGSEPMAVLSSFHHLHDHARLHEHVEGVLTKAGASAAQRQAIDGIMVESMRAQHADFARYHAGLGALKTLLAAPRIDVAAVERVRSQQDQVLLDTDRRLTETVLRIARVLTPEQRRALSTDIDAMMANAIGHHSGH
ncbi:Spy/CpxP family protein refolding chaperone [Cognatilysobacter lacus]|uniref:Periplasmic heavy metal sensor n=1 Tax=Cognatilysobacter lacus TaxID=1643323 RepID=A0A5D8ZAE8_9GAMM|nr:Spy/CpxP family protein refolding chaperone [Lysobacter lacus]TZF89624.1 hypothetical protein FW784_08545 [Lysobacter lacus]